MLTKDQFQFRFKKLSKPKRKGNSFWGKINNSSIFLLFKEKKSKKHE